MYKREIEGTTYTHEFLWRAGTYSLTHAKEQPAGSHYFLTNSFLASVLAFEAFVNFLGQIAAPEAWADERNFFKKKPYQGFEGKVKKLGEVLSCPLDDTDTVFATFRMAKNLRDKIAHGKPVKISESFLVRDSDSKEGMDFMRLAWDQILSISEVERIRGQLQELAERFRLKAKHLYAEEESHFLFAAFEGPLASGAGSTIRIK